MIGAGNPKKDPFIDFIMQADIQSRLQTNLEKPASSSPSGLLTRLFNNLPSLPPHLLALKDCYIEAVNNNELMAWEHLVVGIIVNDLLDPSTGLLKPDILQLLSATPELKAVLAGLTPKEITSYVIDGYVTEFVCGAYYPELAKHVKATDAGVEFSGFNPDVSRELVARILGNISRTEEKSRERDPSLVFLIKEYNDKPNISINFFNLFNLRYSYVLKEFIFDQITRIRNSGIMDRNSYLKTEGVITMVLDIYNKMDNSGQNPIKTPGLKKLINEYVAQHYARAIENSKNQSEDAPIDVLASTLRPDQEKRELSLYKTLNRPRNVLSATVAQINEVPVREQVAALFSSLSKYQNQLHNKLANKKLQLNGIDFDKEVTKIKSGKNRDYVNFIIVGYLNNILSKGLATPDKTMAAFIEAWKKSYPIIEAHGDKTQAEVINLQKLILELSPPAPTFKTGRFFGLSAPEAMPRPKSPPKP